MIEEDGAVDDGGEVAGLASYFNDSRGRRTTAAADAVPLPGKVGSPSETDNESQLVAVLLQAYYQMLDVPPRISRKLCAGVWDAARRLVRVARPVDTVSRTTGRTETGHTVLQPEEWLLHFQHGVLSIASGSEEETEPICSSRNAWGTAVGNAGLDLNAFRVYAFLRRLGTRSPTAAGAACANTNSATPKHTAYSVYKPDSHYKKRSPGPPRYKAIVNA
ncbi:tRNA splicing endonuclease 54 [Coemansia spiralis]|uniref:tRNA splicing endonuclease 54 n=1 Tax=Coemansia spiralis TaxID=417178 RepID=A0A9W8GM82_9FUNG|nr:tRNA splicing endonuclease 54 [Coemansia spiralis]